MFMIKLIKKNVLRMAFVFKKRKKKLATNYTNCHTRAKRTDEVNFYQI